MSSISIVVSIGFIPGGMSSISIEAGHLEALFRRKIQQARESVHADVCPAAASVVRFEEPAIISRNDDEPR